MLMALLLSIRAPAPPQVTLFGSDIDRVAKFKLFQGIAISSSLRWDEHVDSTRVKANKRLYFLSVLKRSAMTPADLLLYHTSVIRSAIEYACPAW
jgi:Domain of unknown function (DUF1891)